ncbi:NAD-dependent epimerase/dehydratase family protein [Enterobacter sp. Bisph1]|uniref:NAD-dependent epimerase/dehydratase family protein n=1 Tax=Enterobacter sp. Bisph1 TaxID=1274399 RepID=UPI000ACF373E|nr:NAD-dependent epimerase/dehydratase family protein [Enterobacter sp. Bisph1]
MMKILVTGITGFLGSRLSEMLLDKSFDVIGSSRAGNASRNIFATGDIDGDTDWQEIVFGCDAVIHAAGRAHILNDNEKDIAAAFNKINCEATIKLAEDAFAAGVKHFIFISSIGVNGESMHQNAISEKSVPNPTSPYAISKFNAERRLLEKYRNTQMAVTIIRPALICGPGAPGNINRLLKLVGSGLPLPFKKVNNLRSMASLDNVCDFIIHCVNQPEAKDEVFVFSDEEELSIEDITKLMSAGMGKKARLFFFPSFLLKLLLTSIGRKKMYEQLFSSFSIDSTKSRALMKWKPVVTIQDTLFATGKAFHEGNR